MKKNKTTTKLSKISRLILFSLIVSGMFFAFDYVVEHDLYNKYFNSGSVTGVVIDLEGNPLDGEAFIIGYPDEVEIEADGTFLLKNVHVGNQGLAIAQDGYAVEYPITVYKNKTINVGQIVYIYVE